MIASSRAPSVAGPWIGIIIRRSIIWGVQGGSRPWCPWSSAHYPWLRLRARRGGEAGSPL